MGVTGWLDAGEPQEPRAGGFAGFILANRAAPDQGRTLEQVLARARARDREPEPYDDDDRQAALLTRGYAPGMLQHLAQQLGDTEAELAAEREKIEKGARRAGRIHQAHQAGRLDAFAVMRAMDFDEGDENRVRQLEHRARSLQAQIGEAQNMITPPQRRDLDPVEAASRAAHEAFRQATRAAWEAAQSGTARPAPRPFASVSRSGGTEHTGPDCRVCAAARERDAARDREDFAAVYGAPAPTDFEAVYGEISR